jgi:hypothetical protein
MYVCIYICMYVRTYVCVCTHQFEIYLWLLDVTQTLSNLPNVTECGLKKLSLK